jgi:hypothetical protein
MSRESARSGRALADPLGATPAAAVPIPLRTGLFSAIVPPDWFGVTSHIAGPWGIGPLIARASLRQVLQKVVGLDQIQRPEAFREGLIDGAQHSSALLHVASIAPQTAQPDGSSQLRHPVVHAWARRTPARTSARRSRRLPPGRQEGDRPSPDRTLAGGSPRVRRSRWLLRSSSIRLPVFPTARTHRNESPSVLISIPSRPGSLRQRCRCDAERDRRNRPRALGAVGSTPGCRRTGT